MSTSRDAKVERSTTRILRDKGIDPSIKCTSTLVANYNAEEDANVRKAMRIWLSTHIEEFSKINPGSIPKMTITEFMNLAEIRVKELDDAELVRRVYSTVRHVVTQERKDSQIFYVLALEYILSTVDSSILQEDARSLISLANCLIEMTDPRNGPLTRTTFAYNASCLHALERVLTVLHELEKHSSEKSGLVFFEDTMNKHLSKLISCQRYYPFAYQAFLIKENIKTLLEKDTKTLLINAGRRAFYAFCGGLYIFQGVRELAIMKLDFSAMESGIGKFREAFKDIGWTSMTDIQEIVLAASETSERNDFETFHRCYNKYKKVSWLEGMKWSKQRAIRYALISQLCLFCTEEHSIRIQGPALDLLIRLVTEKEGKRWRNDDQIFEAMIEALIAVGKRNQEYKENVIYAFNAISTSQTKQHEKIIDECLIGMSIVERIKTQCQSHEDSTSCSLFQTTRQKLGLHKTSMIYIQNRQTLEDHYKSDSFAKVSLFADDCDQRHIKTFDFNLEEYEEVVVSRDSVDRSSHDNYSQRENNLQRTMKVKKPITLQNLFKMRKPPSHDLYKGAQCVLVIGNPGTGKTSLSKRLCYDWANGSWGLEFTRVYLLPIRRLSDTLIGSCGDFSSIVLQLIYHVSGTQISNEGLYGEVKDNLSNASTLLILDGYDEASETAKDLVSSSFQLGCCVLILSRPHSLQAIRPRVEVEVECLEFSDKQLDSFVHREFGPSNGADLLDFFAQHFSIKNTCRVAVNAQIITRLWKSSYKEELTKSSCANLANFYYMTSKYIWTRFTNKEDKFDANKTFDSLELIAFESFEKGQVEIPEHLVFKHAQESMKVFCASGFMLFVKEGSVFQFAHLTFHEYFAGRYLARMLKSTNGEERKKAEKFIAEHKYIETTRVMLSFMTQCYCMRDDTEANLQAFKDLMQVLESDPVPIISLQHLFLRMRALDAFLPCGLVESRDVQTSDVVMQIENDALDALTRWFGYELSDDRRRDIIVHDSYFLTLIVDELARLPSLFNQFPHLLKPILLNADSKDERESEYRYEIAKIGRLNPHHALQCIEPMLDNGTLLEQTCMIELCAFIGPPCAEPALDLLKELRRALDFETREIAATLLVNFLDLYSEREDVRHLVLGALRDRDLGACEVLVKAIRFTSFTPETKAGPFVWDVLVEAIKGDYGVARRRAFKSCLKHYQTFARSLDEVMELVGEFATSPDEQDRCRAAYVIGDLIHKAPEKSEELIALVKALCRDHEHYVRFYALISLEKLVKSSFLSGETLFKMALDLLKDGYPNVQLTVLPFLFSFDKKENHGVNKVDEWIATCQDLDARVQKKAISCSAANALLSKYTIEEIYDKFFDQGKEVQMELVKQFDLKEMESNKANGAIAAMAAHCRRHEGLHGPYRSVLDKLSKTELFPKMVLQELAKTGWGSMDQIRAQPLSHLLEYYWMTKDLNMVNYIAKKLLPLAVIFEMKGETEMTISFREKGANVKQTAPVAVVQEFLTLCKDCLRKRRVGLPL